MGNLPPLPPWPLLTPLSIASFARKASTWASKGLQALLEKLRHGRLRACILVVEAFVKECAQETSDPR
eukprot:1600788-Pyramimonas_sp.AAC.1